MMNQNNLDAIRLIAAFLVLFYHSFALIGLPAPLFLSWVPLGTLGVYIFFIISGYLITASWQRDSNLFRYITRRILRIFPGLIVCVLLTLLVLGPFLTTLPLNHYFSNRNTWYYLHNIGLYTVYSLPGVFAKNPYPNAVNGSLWSLPIECLLYLIVAATGSLSINRVTYVLLAAASGFITLFWASPSAQPKMLYGTDLHQVFIYGTYFWMGAVFHAFDLKRYLTLSSALIACLALISLAPWPLLLTLSSWVLLPIAVLSLGLAHTPFLMKLTKHGDISYGFYIYAFPVQQTIAYLYPNIGIGRFLLNGTLLTLALATLSWYLVEHRALRFKPMCPPQSHPACA